MVVVSPLRLVMPFLVKKVVLSQITKEPILMESKSDGEGALRGD